MRERAGKSIKLLKKYSGGDYEEVTQVSGKTFIEFMPWNREFDYQSHGLDAACADDKILAVALLLGEQRPGAEVVIATEDINLELKVKSLRIAVLSLPEEVKIPAKPDAERKQIQQLEKQIRGMQLSVPQLRIKFVGGEVSISRIKLPRPSLIGSPVLFGDLRNLMFNYPRWRVPETDTAKSLPAAAADDNSERQIKNSFEELTRQLKQIPPAHVQAYNRQLEAFYQAYIQYRNDYAVYENECNLIYPCDFVLVNEGTVPAKDIDVYFQAPDGVSFLFENNLPTVPIAPAPPEPPQEVGVLIGTGIASVLRKIFVASPKTIKLYLPQQENNSISPSEGASLTISEDNRQLICKLKYLKHNMQYSFRFYLRLESYAAAQSFPVEYAALVANIQQRVEGSLHFVVEK